MSCLSFARPFVPALFLCFAYSILLISSAAAIELPELVVTPDRSPEDASHTGSAVTVIDGDTIRSSGASTLSEVIEAVPGVSLTRSGGPAGATSVRIRGAEPGHTLVLIDGMPANDPSRASGGFNFELMALDGVERIEVLRGPQSALYGSEAIGGVINIVTKKGSGPMRMSLTGEAGSYGTRRFLAGVSGGMGALTLSAGLGRVVSNGYSSLAAGTEKDGYERLSGYANIGLQAGDNVRFELALKAQRLISEYDTVTFCCGLVEKGYEVRGHLLSARGNMLIKAYEGLFKNRFSVYAQQNKRTYDEAGVTSHYRGRRIGTEYQGDLSLEQYGKLIFGAGAWQDYIETTGFSALSRTLDGYNAFALYRFTLWDKLHISMGGRYDEFSQSGGFLTYRVTAALDLFDGNTKLRGSVGTGARAPTGFQLFDPTYGNPLLSAEESFGVDIGIDHKILDGRGRLSVTAFYNEFTNLIDYFDPDGFIGPIPGSYYNIASAKTYGVEVGGGFQVIPGLLDAGASYTYLWSKDLSTGKQLARRPNHTGSVSLTYTGIEKLKLRGKLTYIGDRFNSTDFVTGLPTEPMKGFVRVDLFADYKVNDNVTVFGRIENLFDERYQEVAGYNTAGFSAYLGARLTN